ncbi:MAG: hypothetical protein AAF747_07450 [Planctomycetota bacterium]
MSASDVTGTKIAAGVCGILLGQFGIHKFIVGNVSAGLVMLILTISGYVGFFCLVIPGIIPGIMGIIGLIEGIIYLTKSDAEFKMLYIVGNKGWF